MSLLESKVKPIMAPLIMGHPTVLTEDKQKAIARWLVMKFMVVEFIKQDQPITPQSERLYVIGNNSPPPNWRIWIGHQKANLWNTAYFAEAATLGPISPDKPPAPPNNSFAKNTQSISFGIGDLFVQAIHTTIAGLEFNPPPEFHALCQIWPFKVNFLWPPGDILLDRDSANIANAFRRGIQGAQWMPGPEGE
jgi:hypothetical protein